MKVVTLAEHPEVVGAGQIDLGERKESAPDLSIEFQSDTCTNDLMMTRNVM